MRASETDHEVVAHEPGEGDVALVGMSGRFPGARDVDALWRRVVAGDDCLTDVTPEEARRGGVSRRRLRSGDHVLRDGVIEGVADFDREFFGVSTQDAAVMDPQQRHFLECSWEALESAGWTPETFPGAIGVFGGVGMNTYLLHNLLTNPDLVERYGWFLLRHTANDKDFLTTTLSYRLGLTGPSVNVQTACSTSLVAVHLAVQSLLSYECDMALAGGVTIEFPHGVGYEYREGEILSPSGRCRSFDAASEGTVLTGGVAVVTLRRYADALADGDPVLAVLRGSAVNNDGNRKVGYLAPSVDGHADVVKEALAVSGVDAREVGLLEAHGTGTAVGDPIEVAALTEAFRHDTDDTGFCRLVSTKPNIGHLDTAAGTASLVKVVQALRHRTLPPLANHTGPSPLLDIERTPFELSGTAAPWPAEGRPRIAGVSSLGVGGTNAHVVVQEAPPRPDTPSAHRGQVLVLSGRTRAAVDEGCERLAAWFEDHPTANVADVAHTLRHGRRAMQVRRVVAVTDATTAPAELRAADRRLRPTNEAPEVTPRLAFAFPGGGAQYVGMGAGLDERFEVFHRVRREGAAAVRALGGVDLDELFSPDTDPEALRAPTASLPAVFVTSVALARQLEALGLEPDALLGHSLGEYVAAHLAGVLTLQDALTLVVRRAELMQRASGSDAAMLVVPLPEDEVASLLAEPWAAPLSLATVNAADECVVAGPSAAVRLLEQRLDEREVPGSRIPLVAAAHSALLDPVLPAFHEIVRGVTLSPPTRRYVSNLTGDWITPEQATDPQYWVDHLRGTVRFAQGVQTVLSEAPTVVLEVGPGHSLSSYVRRSGLAAGAFGALRHPEAEGSDTNATLTALGQLWAHGVEVDLDRFMGEGRRRLRLPTYAFARQRHWVEPGRGSALGPQPDEDEALVRLEDVARMTWRPVWQEAAPLATGVPRRRWHVVGGPGAGPVALAVAAELRARGHEVVDAEPEQDEAVAGVVVVGGLDDHTAAAATWLDLAPRLARALGRRAEGGRLVAVTRGACAVDGAAAAPAGALARGVVAVGPTEYADLETAQVDLGADVEPSTAVAAVVDEVLGAAGVVALRDGVRCSPTLVHERVDAAPEEGFVTGGTYLVTGALGGVGGVLARHLATAHDATLVVVSREAVPAGEERQRFLRDHALDHPTVRRIRSLEALEAIGGKVAVVTGDLGDPAAVRDVLDEAERRVGRLDGALHAAGTLRDRLLELAEPEDLVAVTRAKSRPALVLADELRRRGSSLLVLVSSTSTWLAPAGQTGYVAANAVLDAMAGRHGGLRVATLGSGMWAGTGMAVRAARRTRLGLDDGRHVDHPVLAELSEGPRGRVTLSGRLRTDHHWVVDEHRTEEGVAVLPGTGHLELLLAAAALAGVGGDLLVDVTLQAPLVVPDDASVTVRVVVDPQPEGGARLQLDSDGGEGHEWTTHSEATAGLVGEPAPERLDVAATGARCPLDEPEPLAALRRHLRVGARWDSLVEARVGDGEAVGRLRLDDGVAGEVGRWVAHPALVDVATAVGVLLAAPGRAGSLHVPVAYERVHRWAPVPAEAVVHARRRDRHDDELLVVDVLVADTGGSGALRIEGLQLRPVATTASISVSPPAPPALPPPGAGLLGLVDEIGLRPAEGTALLDALVASREDRLVVSSVDLEALRDHAVAEQVDEGDAAPAPATGAPTGATVVDRMAVIWSDLLGVEEVGEDDDFFDLGGHSLIAIRLMSRIGKDLGVRLQLSSIFDAPTLGALAALVRAERPELETGGDAPDDGDGDERPRRTTRHHVPISRTGDGRPLHVVHGAGGNVLFLWSLARALGGTRPIFGFQAHGIDGDDMPDSSIEEMAARYVTELREHGPGPYLLGGYSGGGSVALEMVRQLQAQGEQVDHVLLFDSVPGGRALLRRRQRWVRLARRVLRDGIEPVRPYLVGAVKETLRRFFPERQQRLEQVAEADRDLGYEDVEVHGFVNLFYYFSAAEARYPPSTYDVDVTVLKADLVWPVQPDDYHWGEHVTGELSWRTVPGNHESMFYPENAPVLAEAVREALEAVDPVDVTADGAGAGGHEAPGAA